MLQVFIGSFIFFYPDVVTGQDLPITGGLAAVCAFAVLLIKLMRHSDESTAFRWQVILIGLGAMLYIVPYLLGVQMTKLHGQRAEQLVPILVSRRTPTSPCRCATCPDALVGVHRAWSRSAYNLRSTGRRPADDRPGGRPDECRRSCQRPHQWRVRMARPVGRGGPADDVDIHAGHALRPAGRHPVPPVA